MRILKLIVSSLFLVGSLFACQGAAPAEPTQVPAVEEPTEPPTAGQPTEAPLNIPQIGGSSVTEVYPAPVESIEQTNLEAYPVPPVGGVTPPMDLSGPYPMPDETVALPTSGYEPTEQDKNLTRGEVFLDLVGSELLQMESYPVQVTLMLRGDLPTTCHQLRVLVTPTDAQNRVQVEVYSMFGAEEVCAQVLKPFEASIPLGSYAGGKFSVYVNGELLGEFDA